MQRLSASEAGWTRYDATGLPPVYLRWTPNDRGRLVLRELFIDASESEPLTAATLGRIPVPALEAFVNRGTPIRERVAGLVDTVSPVGGPATGSNVAVLMSHYDVNFGVQTDPAANWCAAAQLATGKGSKHKVKKRRPSQRRQTELDTDYRLTSPPGPDGLSDEFLSRVHRAYVAASLRGESPNQTIAADLRMPIDPATGRRKARSVERWVYEARKRGVMPPARAKGARG